MCNINQCECKPGYVRQTNSKTAKCVLKSTCPKPKTVWTCEDVDQWKPAKCEKKKDKKWCETKEDKMLKKCPSVCGFCEKACVNKKDDDWCEKKQEKGKCTKGGVQKKCAKTCVC